MIYPGHMYGTWIVRECPFADHESYGLNFLQVSGIAGNIGFVMFTCIGADPRDFVSEACTFMKQKDPKLAAGQNPRYAGDFIMLWNLGGWRLPSI